MSTAPPRDPARAALLTERERRADWRLEARAKALAERIAHRRQRPAPTPVTTTTQPQAKSE